VVDDEGSMREFPEIVEQKDAQPAKGRVLVLTKE